MTSKSLSSPVILLLSLPLWPPRPVAVLATLLWPERFTSTEIQVQQLMSTRQVQYIHLCVGVCELLLQKTNYSSAEHTSSEGYFRGCIIFNVAKQICAQLPVWCSLIQQPCNKSYLHESDNAVTVSERCWFNLIVFFFKAVVCRLNYTERGFSNICLLGKLDIRNTWQ